MNKYQWNGENCKNFATETNLIKNGRKSRDKITISANCKAKINEIESPMSNIGCLGLGRRWFRRRTSKIRV